MFSTRLRKLRQEKGLSQQQLSGLIGISKSSINMYERGEREPGIDTLKSIASFFNINLDFLLGNTGESRKGIPLLGEIACGQPIFAHQENQLLSGAPKGADFCLIAKGDSMIGARIMDGDLVFIRSQQQVENGEIAAVIIEDSATLKRVYYYPAEQKLALNAENPQYPPLIYIGEELERIKILGKAIGFQSKL